MACLSLVGPPIRSGNPGRDGYDLRHNLRFGREGFALPNLLIKPTGARALLEWHPFHLPEAQISFTGNGTRVVPLRSIQEALAALIDTVLDRLDQQGVTDSYGSDKTKWTIGLTPSEFRPLL